MPLSAKSSTVHTFPGSDVPTSTRPISIAGSKSTPTELQGEGAGNRASNASTSFARTSLPASRGSASKPSLFNAPTTTTSIPVPIVSKKQFGAYAKVWPTPKKDTSKTSLGGSGSTEYEKSTW